MHSPDTTRTKRVALLIDTATSWGAGLIEGVADFAKDNDRPWVFSLEPRGKYDPMTLPARWRVDGVVARVTHTALSRQLIELKVPAVNVSWYRHGESVIPRCTCDEAAAAEMAADYFLNNGYRQFAYCASTLRPSYYDRFGDAYVSALQKGGWDCALFSPDYEQFSTLDSEEQLAELSSWLVDLPKPIALLAFDDLQARQVTEACYHAGVAVPDDIAVLGGEHDDLCSKISSPPLSGIDQGATDVGFRAAEMLDKMMSGHNLPDDNVRLPPRRIITRQSTDKVAIKDDLLADAIRYIRMHCTDRIRIRDILEAVPLSRRAMELGFRRHLGRTPREEIRRVRVQKAVGMLCDTDLPITRIALDCGFERPELLTRAFQKELKSTPSAFRKKIAVRTALATTARS